MAMTDLPQFFVAKQIGSFFNILMPNILATICPVFALLLRRRSS